MKPSNSFNIGDKLVGADAPVYFIADIAANHDGSLERAVKLIELAAESGANAAKFQHFKAQTIVSDKGFKALGGNLSHQATWSKSVYEVYSDASLSLDWTISLKEACDRVGIAFFSSPYAADLLDHLDPYVPAYKIGSGDITWLEMIESVALKSKPYILASGASTADDVYRAVSTGLKINPDICLMQCNTNYTASLENFRFIQLNVLKTFRSMYPDMVLGLSDHTPGHSTVLGAVSLGAKMIEKHFTDDVQRVGPDHKFSMDPRAWSEMVRCTRELENALGDGIKRIEDNELETVVLQRRGIYAARDIAPGEILCRQDLILLRPCPSGALPPYMIDSLIGKTLKNSMQSGESISWIDIR